MRIKLTIIATIIATPLYASVSAPPKIAAPPEVQDDDFNQFQRDVKAASGALQTVQTAAPGSNEQKQAQTTLTKSETAIAGFADKYPKNPAANQLAGRSLVKLGDYDRAAPIADRSVSLATEKGDAKLMAQALLLRGDVHYGKKDYAAALRDADAVLKLDPNNKAGLALKHQAAGRAGTDGSKASPAAGANAASGAGPNASVPPANVPGAASAAFGAPDGAKAAAAVTTTESRQKSDALAREAAQRVSIDPAAARDLAEKAVALDPRNARAYFARAAARRAAGDLMGAMEDLDRTLAAEPGFTEAHAVKASVGVALGRSTEEIKAEFLASGRAPAGFADYYRDQLAALGGRPKAAGGGSAADRSWTAASLPARARENAGTLLAVGLGLALFGLALRWQTAKRMGDGSREG